MIHLTNLKTKSLTISDNECWNIQLRNNKIERFRFGDNRIRDAIIIEENHFGQIDSTDFDNPQFFVNDSTNYWGTFFNFESDHLNLTTLFMNDNYFESYSQIKRNYNNNSNSFNKEVSHFMHHVLISGAFDVLSFNNNQIKTTLEFYNTNIESELIMNGNNISGLVSIRGLFFSEKKNSIQWSQFSNFRLFTVKRTVSSMGSPIGTTYNVDFNTANTQREIQDSLEFLSVVTSYKTLYDTYKKNNELESANACYAEMKKVETRRWKYLYQQNKTFESFFRWQLNAFLSYFTDYGTNPAKAVIKSGWVILLFAIFYLFFPSDWDVTNRAEFLQKWKQFLTLKSQDESGKSRFAYFLSTLTFVLFTGFIHVLNALTLSLNAFTTLGFGEIPTHGAARYVTIVQGFIGWFLLTIFSVSLINQVLG